jgi:hypothetical protein
MMASSLAASVALTLPLEGFNIILNFQGLKILQPIAWDFMALCNG